MSEKELAEELAKEIIEEVKEFLHSRADALDLKSTHRSIERSIKKILRKHTISFNEVLQQVRETSPHQKIRKG